MVSVPSSLILQFIHNSNILHNDLKQDNVVLVATKHSSVKPFNIDFGKACFMPSARTYQLSEEEKLAYKLNHTQIAPDLRDGLVKQSVHTDTYSLGRIFKKTNSTVIKSAPFGMLVKDCLQYHSHCRPSLHC